MTVDTMTLDNFDKQKRRAAASALSQFAGISLEYAMVIVGGAAARPDVMHETAQAVLRDAAEGVSDVKDLRYSFEQMKKIIQRDSTIFARQERYNEKLAAYQQNPTLEKAAALRAAVKTLRDKQREIGLLPEPNNQSVALAFSQLRKPRGKGGPQTLGKRPRGRPKLSNPQQPIVT